MPSSPGPPYRPTGPMKGTRVGHTFTKHGSHNTRELLLEAANTGRSIGQWLDDPAAERFIASCLLGLSQGSQTFDLPPDLGRQINPDGTFTPATKATIVPSKSGVKTAYPFAES